MLLFRFYSKHVLVLFMRIMDLIYHFIPDCVKTYVTVSGGGDKEGQKCLDRETL